MSYSGNNMLPICASDMKKLGWSELDVLLVSGDAYIDHPSFAAALLGRFLVSKGYRVGLVCQPRWDRPDDFLVMGRPRLLVGVSGGALDSMLAHYTAFRKKRHDDAFTPGGKAGARPNRAIIVYTNLVRQAFPGLPVVIGGIEASLRRYTHYDFWSDNLRRSILLDSKADALVYGMGEYSLWNVVKRVEEAWERNRPVSFEGLNGLCYMAKAEDIERLENPIVLPSHEEIVADSEQLVKASLLAERHIQAANCACVQQVGNRYLVATPPTPSLSQAEMDKIYDLPFTRKAHPSYKEPIPALEMIKTSINSHRGCGGGCSFCSLALHQGRRIASRSERSILTELEKVAKSEDFKGSISDVGGPTANMWQAKCGADPSKCRRSSCMFPKVCPNFKDQQDNYVALLRKVLAHPKVKHVRIASGVRFDLALKNYVDEAIVIQNGEENVIKSNYKIENNDKEIVKVDIKKKNLSELRVKFKYNIQVTNQGEVAGYAKEIKDYIPKGLSFEQAENPTWTKLDNGTIVTEALADKLLQPGESAEVTIILTWINSSTNIGLKSNIAEISEDYNEYETPDIDSIPNNMVLGEDDIDNADVMLTVKTGSAQIAYLIIALVFTSIIVIGGKIIKEKVMKN